MGRIPEDGVGGAFHGAGANSQGTVELIINRGRNLRASC